MVLVTVVGERISLCSSMDLRDASYDRITIGENQEVSFDHVWRDVIFKNDFVPCRHADGSPCAAAGPAWVADRSTKKRRNWRHRWSVVDLALAVAGGAAELPPFQSFFRVRITDPVRKRPIQVVAVRPYIGIVAGVRAEPVA